jgi:hypothetical protein
MMIFIYYSRGSEVTLRCKEHQDINTHITINCNTEFGLISNIKENL